MSKKLALTAAFILASIATSGCVPVAVGAVGAVAADSYSESKGNDLF